VLCGNSQVHPVHQNGLPSHHVVVKAQPMKHHYKNSPNNNNNSPNNQMPPLVQPKKRTKIAKTSTQSIPTAQNQGPIYAVPPHQQPYARQQQSSSNSVPVSQNSKISQHNIQNNNAPLNTSSQYQPVKTITVAQSQFKNNNYRQNVNSGIVTTSSNANYQPATGVYNNKYVMVNPAASSSNQSLAQHIENTAPKKSKNLRQINVTHGNYAKNEYQPAQYRK